MNWHRRNKTRGVPALLVVGVALAALALFEWGTGGIVRGAARDLFATAWVGVASIETTVSESGILHTRAALAKENETLKRERDQLRTLQLQNDVLRSENAALRALMNMHTELPTGIAARVLSRPTVSPYGTFVIERDNAAITPGAMVLVAPTVAIGEVLEVSAHTALVSLFSAPNTERDILVGEHLLVYHGLGSGNAYIDAPRTLAITEGMAVRDAVRGFALGSVDAIESSPESPTQRLRVGPPANLPALEYVLVVPTL